MSVSSFDTLQYVLWWFRGIDLYNPRMTTPQRSAVANPRFVQTKPAQTPDAGTAGRAASVLARLVPRSLFSQVTLIIVLGLTTAQLLTFASIRYERGLAMTDLMVSGLQADIASSVAMLDRLPAQERKEWLGRLERPNYRFALGLEVVGEEPRSARVRRIAEAVSSALSSFEIVKVAGVAGAEEGLRIQVRLSDGTAIVVESKHVATWMSPWIVWVLFAQLAVLIACAWYAVRMVTRPLVELARAADALGPDLKTRTLAEEGPTEVAHAARAFNGMQQRIAGYMAERVEILAAISHDLQTPITRMQLRTELMTPDANRVKFRSDLDAMNALVREGVTYARTLHGATEPPCRVDADALLESLVADYEDAGQKVSLDGRVGHPMVARPQALRRILTNLVDNALKFGGEVRVRAQAQAGLLVIAVLDSGPGIPPELLKSVLQPFYRVESSRNRSTGGTGLGLAIAHQLSIAMGAELSLLNRPEGGLEARLTLALQKS
jgi:signal transduction histidine kinase